MSTSAATPVKRRFSPWRFSIRSLLIAFTLFAIGFPIWYRRPYVVREALSPRGGTPVIERLTTWQRQWGGQTVRHGEQRRLSDGHLTELTTFQRGRLHGPFFRNDATGHPEIFGQYVEGLKDGVWVDKTSPLVRTSTWRRGQLHGPYSIAPAGIPPLELEFADGHLTHFRGQPAQNRLYELLEAGSLDAALAAQLRAPTSYKLPRAESLPEVLEELKTLHGVSIALDPRVLQSNFDFAKEQSGLDLCSALTVLTVPHGLECDYRFDCIWITLAGDAGQPDPTGVSDLNRLEIAAPARAWARQIDVAEVETRPLADVLIEYGKMVGVPIDVSRLPPTGDLLCPRLPPTLIEKERFATILGRLLSQTSCRCRVVDRSLVIERQPEPRGMLRFVFVNQWAQAVTVQLDTQHVLSQNGRLIDKRLVELSQSTASDGRLAAELSKIMPVGMQFVQTPLRDAVQYLQDQHGIPIALDPSLAGSPMVVTVSVRGEPLFVALSSMTVPRGLGWDYRYGCLWLTRADDVPGWRDPTGISELTPPPNSKLASAWNRAMNVGAEFVETPLADALLYIRDQEGVSFIPRTALTEEGKSLCVTMNKKGSHATLKNVLGELLYRLDCTCKLDGETLVISPPESP